MTQRMEKEEQRRKQLELRKQSQEAGEQSQRKVKDKTPKETQPSQGSVLLGMPPDEANVPVTLNTQQPDDAIAVPAPKPTPKRLYGKHPKTREQSSEAETESSVPERKRKRGRKEKKGKHQKKGKREKPRWESSSLSEDDIEEVTPGAKGAKQPKRSKTTMQGQVESAIRGGRRQESGDSDQ